MWFSGDSKQPTALKMQWNLFKLIWFRCLWGFLAAQRRMNVESNSIQQGQNRERELLKKIPMRFFLLLNCQKYTEQSCSIGVMRRKIVSFHISLISSRPNSIEFHFWFPEKDSQISCFRLLFRYSWMRRNIWGYLRSIIFVTKQPHSQNLLNFFWILEVEHVSWALYF